MKSPTPFKELSKVIVIDELVGDDFPLGHITAEQFDSVFNDRAYSFESRPLGTNITDSNLF